jgi:hypothetical protein
MMLPHARTCFFALELPPYSSKEILEAKLLYAIRHCRYGLRVCLARALRTVLLPLLSLPPTLFHAHNFAHDRCACGSHRLCSDRVVGCREMDADLRLTEGEMWT